jgi:hypothetical protein
MNSGNVLWRDFPGLKSVGGRKNYIYQILPHLRKDLGIHQLEWRDTIPVAEQAI